MMRSVVFFVIFFLSVFDRFVVLFLVGQMVGLAGFR